jgi:hypothetical protein
VSTARGNQRGGPLFRLSSKSRHTKNRQLHRRIEKGHIEAGLDNRSGCVAGLIYRDWSMAEVQLPVSTRRVGEGHDRETGWTL